MTKKEIFHIRPYLRAHFLHVQATRLCMVTAEIRVCENEVDPIINFGIDALLVKSAGLGVFCDKLVKE